MYIIKVKGVAKIPDYVQLRDEKFTLLAYFRVDRPEKSLEKIGLGDKTDYIMNLVKNLPFGQIVKLDIEK
ncbi:fructose-6-phosphate aldolase [Rubrolithibacter danxiaensis]|uniref:fructose-6-phosphate aldolase n=1 Tax=Rubrolithibacter danxiaensis TaxID=3390805 RepID=UPI003BF85CA2